MNAYTSKPNDDRYYHVDGPNGGATGCDMGADYWRYERDLPGGPFLLDDAVPDGVIVVSGSPPVPADGWQLGDEVVVREVCYAGPQWIFKVMKLVRGESPGVSFSPVGRIAYGQRIY